MHFGLKKNRDPWGFQKKAVSCITNDFKNNIRGRYLLVLPTGGGKTLTAMRAVSEMLKQQIISKEERVVWVVHTLSLFSHAKKNLGDKSNYERFSLFPELASVINVRMKSDAVKDLEHGINYKLIIIDEAHHAAASTYETFFEYPIGILGLTATPNRMDQRELPFDKVSYSTTFRDLMHRKVVLLPKFLPKLKTNLTINASSLQEEEQLESFNNEQRNQLIVHHIFREAEKNQFSKIIVFVGTNAHVLSLYNSLKRNNESLKNKFDHIGYIFGGNNNDKSISNEEYLDWHHSQSSSILINCKILNEGYDDPNIEAVVMATPTNSILYYMQCIGRVVRAPEKKVNARAYVLEIVDKLPNISYRIDNRWLFAEISDFLEPAIEDVKGFWPFWTIRLLRRLIMLRVNIKDLSPTEKVSIIAGHKINLLLFNDVPHNNLGKWRVLSLSENNNEKISFFNELSENINEYYYKNHDYIFSQKFGNIAGHPPFSSRVYRSSLMCALNRAYKKKMERTKVDSLIYLSSN